MTEAWEDANGDASNDLLDWFENHCYTGVAFCLSIYRKYMNDLFTATGEI